MKGKKLTALLLASALTVAAPVSVFAGSWQSNNTGWWYQHDDGSYPANTWLNDGGTWYHFDGNGYMQTGWLNDGWNWYYLHGNGAMATGWLFDGVNWYYLYPSGAMAANQWIGNYYVGPNGAMWTNAWTPDGYWVDASGTWIPGYQQATEGWVLDSNGWWYRNSDGSYPTNTWSMINGSWYYFNTSGYMAANQWIGNYYVGTNGAMMTNAWTPDGYYVGGDGVWIPNYNPSTNNINSPLSAYESFTFDCYNYSQYLGNFTVQLLEYKDGNDALDYIDKYDTYYSKLDANEEYIYLKFKISYNSGEGEVNATDVINHYSGLYNSASNLQINNKGWAYPDTGTEDMVNVSMYPGASTTCQVAIKIDKGNTPITYRLQTGFDSENWDRQFTWFKVK